MDRLQIRNPLYPLVCILSAIALLVVGLFYAKSDYFGLYILTICLLYCFFGLAAATMKCLLVFIPVGAVFALFSFLFQREAVTAFQMAGRVLLIGVSAVPMVTMPPICLTRCLTQLGCPKVITLGMLVAIRFVPLVGGEVRRVGQAMRTRGIRRSVHRAFVVPVMIRLLSISDTMALSLETRAFSMGKEPASVYEPVRFCLRDGVYCGMVAVILTGWMVFV